MLILRYLQTMLRSERGSVALPAAVGMLMLTLALGAVAVGQATTALDGSSRDVRVKRALQAADAGLETALWRNNTLSEALNAPLATLTCAVRVSGGALDLVAPQGIGGAQWCPASGPEEIGNSESFTYSITALGAIDLDGLESTLDRKIVSMGSAGGITRRVTSNASALDVRRLFRDYTVFSNDDLNLSNQADVGSPEIDGNARSNGNIFLNHPNATVYGDATPGPGMTVSGPGSATGSTAPALEPLVLPAVTMPTGAAVDGNVCKTPGGLLNLVWVNCATSGTASQNWWNPITRRLNVAGGTVAMLGNVHSVCSINVSNNSKLLFTTPVLTTTQPVQIYIDTPANCGGSAGLTTNNNPEIRTAQLNLGLNVPLLSSIPTLTNPILQIYAAGNSPININNNSATPGVPMTIYAPSTTVTIGNYARLTGGIAANRVTLGNNSEVIAVGGSLGDLVSSILPLYSVGRYRECAAAAPAAGQAPDTGC